MHRPRQGAAIVEPGLDLGRFWLADPAIRIVRGRLARGGGGCGRRGGGAAAAAAAAAGFDLAFISWAIPVDIVVVWKK